MINNWLFKRYVINYFGKLPDILRKMGTNIPPNGVIYCPMHDNTKTPAAKLYKDSNGWCFYCFTEGKVFGTYDVYKEIFNYNMDEIFNQLWNSLSEAQKESVEQLFGEYDIDKPVEDIDLYNAFKMGQIDYSGLVDRLAEIK